MARITKTFVDDCEPDPGGGRRTIWDDALPGFGLIIYPTGVKSYIFQYRTRHGRSRRAAIGKNGDWTAAEARRTAERWRQEVRDGGDPLGDKKAAREALSVGELLDQYLTSEKFAQKAESTQAIDRGRVERHLRPLLGSEICEDLTTEAVRRAMVKIRDGRTKADVKTRPRGRAIVRGGAGTARKAIALLRAVFSWGVAERLVPGNPAMGIELGSDGTRDVVLESADQYRALFEALERMERERRIRGPVADAIRIIALTGARRGEIAGLRWRHVDLDRGLLTLPATSHKTGRRTGQARTIGLPAAAQACIARQASGEPDDWVFPPSHGEGPIQLSGIWREVRREAGLPEAAGLHALRHSLASSMAMEGATQAELMAALGHRDPKMASRYVHWAQSQHQRLAERAASVALAGMAAASGGEVVELKPRPARKR